jgi:uncharacterized phiE125 gp8 family phage protein
MNFVLERISEPEIEPVTLAEAIAHVREFSSISQAAQDDLTGWIKAAREWLEGLTGRTLIDTTYRLTVDDFTPPNRTATVTAGSLPLPQDGILLRRSPVIEIASVATVDSDGEETVIDSDDYELCEPDSKWPRVIGLTAATRLRIEFRAGFADRTGSPQTGAEVVPQVFKNAMKLWIEAHYDRDKDMMEKLIAAATALVKDYRANLQIA